MKPNRILIGLVTAHALCASAMAQTAQTAEPVVAFPYYNAAHAMRGLHQHLLLPRAQAFFDASQMLARQTGAYCAASSGGPALGAVRLQWQATLQTWEAFSSVAIGPVLERRSQRQIDFWPARPSLIERAIAREPQGEQAMELVGTPAKGLPALEWLLWTQPVRPATPACAYAGEVAQAIVREASALLQAETSAGAFDWDEDEAAASKGLTEWVNQWIGALERLSWEQMQKPVKAAAPGERPAYPRSASGSDAMSWQTQWRTLREHAGLTPEQRRAPPAPGKALAPIEALLIGKGHVALAARWSKALDQAGLAMASADPARPPSVLTAAQSLKSVEKLLQGDVVSSLDISLGFSSADGD
jgi:uncharacterized protein